MRLNMVRGDRAVFELAIRDAVGDALSLAGKELYFTAKTAVSDLDADAVIVKAIATGIVVTDEAGGIAEVTIDPADTEDLTAETTLVYDVEMRDPVTSDVATVVLGTLIVVPDVRQGTVAP